MNCGEIRDTLLLLPAGEPAGDGVGEHLAVCGDCARTAELAQAAWDLAGADEDEAPPTFARRASRPVRWLRAATAAAAAVVLAVVGWASLGGRKAPETVQFCDGPISGYLEPAFGTLTQEGPEPGPLGLRSHSVSVTLDDWVMRTEVEEIFVNTTGQRLEGTFVFPLPPNASLSRFAMEVEGTLVEGELVERVRAREVYEGIVRQMKDPALLEWMPGNVFKARVFPIEPYSEKRILLAYTQAPRLWNGAVGYVYPLVSEKTQAHPPEELAIRASWAFGKPVRRIDCPTHRADVQRRDERSGRAELVLRGARPAQDFQLRLEMDPDELAAAGHRPEGEDGFVGVAFAPKGAGKARAAGTTVFVVDRSARMSEKELEIARRVVDRMIAHLSPDERVGFVAHHVDVEARAPEVATAERRREWRDFLWGLKGEGASDVLGAIRRAAELGGDPIVYVGKGVPTWGETDPSKADLGGRAFRAVLVGSGTGEGTLAALGEIRRIVAGGDTGAEIEAVARTAGLEPLRGLEMEIGSERHPLPSIYPGERVFLFARYAAPGRTRISAGGRAIEVDLPAGPTEHRPLMRLWAQGALETRVSECRRAGEPREAVDAIVAMSRKFQVMTPYTSFLVLESEKAYEQYRIERVKRLDEGEGDGRNSRKASERAEIAARLFRDGERLLVEGRYAEAVNRLEAAEKTASKDLLPMVRESLGHARMASRRPGQGAEWSELLAKLKASYEVGEQAKASQADEYYRFAERLYQAGDFEKAALECEKALSLNARHAAATALRIEVDFILGRSTPPARLEYDQYMKEAVVRHQQTLVEVDNALERGRRLEQSGDRDAAEREYRKILEFAKWMPTGVELETRRKQAQERLQGRAEDGGGEFRVRVEQGQIEIAKHVRDGERFLEARMYERAKKELEAAQFKIQNIPYDVKPMSDLLPYVRDSIVKAEHARILDERRTEAEKRRSVEAEAAPHDLATRREVTRKMAHLLELTYMAFDQKRFDRAIRLADEILLIDPHYSVARELREDAQKSRHKEEYYPVLAQKVERWKRMTDDDEQAVIPFAETLRFPSRDEWSAVSKRLTESVIKTEGGTAEADSRRERELLFGQARLHFEREQFVQSAETLEKLLRIDPGLRPAAEMRDVAQRMQHMKRGRDDLKKCLDDWEVQIATAAVKLDPLRKPKGISELEEDLRPEDKEIQDKLKSIRITIDLKNAPLTAVVDYVREVSGLNLHLQGIEKPDQQVMSVKVQDTVLDAALRSILAPRGQGFEIKDGVVIITTEEAIRKRVRLELHDVQDLTYGMQDFPGVDVTLAGKKVGLRPKVEPAGRRLPPKELLATFEVRWVGQATPLEALQQLSDRSGIAFSFEAGVEEKLGRISARPWTFEGTILGEAIRRVLEPACLDHFLNADGTVSVGPRQITGEDLVAKIRAAVLPDSWSEADGRTIQFQNGLLIVRNTAEVHAAIRKFLQEMRK
jgi:Ca-activated chloride channel family protein